MNIDRRVFLKSTPALLGLGASLATEAEAYQLIDSPSPRRNRRPNRKDTRYILLHTTEASGSSSLNSLTRGGKANYMVDTGGKIYRIMRPNQVSIGAGRSMWNGTANLDNHAINIENVGYHNRPLTQRQYASLKDLLTDLQKQYRISDERVMPHSQVAYGRPNKWQRRSHRGRKRCGMLFATEPVREKLGLTSEVRYDPDVRAGRLVIADPFLANVVYGGSRDEPSVVAKAETPSIQEASDEDVAIRKVERGQTVWGYAGDEYANATTIYMLNDGRVRRGDELMKEKFDFDHVPEGTRMAVGYTYGGHVHRRTRNQEERTAYDIAQRDWNRPDTLYIFDGKIVTGDDINDTRIPEGTLVLFRR